MEHETARFVGACGIIQALGVEFDLRPWVESMDALARGERPPLEHIATLSDWEGVDADLWSAPDARERLLAAMTEAASNTAEDYHRRYAVSEAIDEINEALGTHALLLPQLLEDAKAIAEKAESADGTHAALSRILGALGAPAPADPRALTRELEGALGRWGRSALARTLAETEAHLRRLSRDLTRSKEDRDRARAALDAWRLARTVGGDLRDASDAHEVTWEATPTQSMGVASAVELALLLGADPAEVDRALVKSAGNRDRALAALRQLCERRRIQEENAERTIRARDDIDQWARRQGEVLAVLGPFARDPEWVGVLHRMISELTDALGNGHLPGRDLVIVSEQVLAASGADLLALRVVQAEAQAAIQRQRADRMEAAVRAAVAPSMTRCPWPEGTEIHDAIGQIEVAAGKAIAWSAYLSGIADPSAPNLGLDASSLTAARIRNAMEEIGTTLGRAGELLAQFAGSAMHRRNNADVVVLG